LGAKDQRQWLKQICFSNVSSKSQSQSQSQSDSSASTITNHYNTVPPSVINIDILSKSQFPYRTLRHIHIFHLPFLLQRQCITSSRFMPPCRRLLSGTSGIDATLSVLRSRRPSKSARDMLTMNGPTASAKLPRQSALPHPPRMPSCFVGIRSQSIP
jgi:hypothetical protein